MEQRAVRPLGPIVRAYRESQGLTQVQLAEKLGIDQATLSRLEGRNESAPLDRQSVPTVKAVAKYMGLEPDYFMEYRLWRVQEIARQNPELADEVYDLLIAYADREGSEGGKKPAK